MKKGITLKDMARKLNMSISTVSKSLNNDGAISTLTKERVKELANKWNYVANESARHFKLNKSFTIGLIIPDLLDRFFVEAVNGIEEIAEKEDYNLIVTQFPDNVCLNRQAYRDGDVFLSFTLQISGQFRTFHSEPFIG